MNITQRRYKLFADFEHVHQFLTDTYDPETLNSYLLPQCICFETICHRELWEKKWPI
jgi:hypothetical protein